MVYLIDYKQYNICKDVLIKMCNQFKTLPKNDLCFLLAQKNMIDKHPEMASYIHQFFFEAAYFKRTFKDQDIIFAFEEKFKIIDHYFINGGLSNASTY